MKVDGERKMVMLMRALQYMGKLLRVAPPDALEVPENLISPEEYIGILADGANRDPEGNEFIAYFLDKAYVDTMTVDDITDTLDTI